MGAVVKNRDIKFNLWLAEAPAGNVHEYHRGALARDRDHGGTSATKRVAMAALAASDRSEVHLLQKRHGPLDYSYLAQKR